jgi:regulator of nucleoside diphosphate kinase
MSMNRKRPKPPKIFLSASDHNRLDQMLGDVERSGAGALLRREVDRATVVPDNRAPGNTVGLYRWVHFMDGEGREARRVQLVLPPEADIDEGRVSVLSWVGAGLLGLKEGDSIDWPDASGRERRLTPILVEP